MSHKSYAAVAASKSPDDRQKLDNAPSYSYQLYDVFSANKAQDQSHIASKLAEFFKYEHNAESIIYPTHDNKCYVNFKRANFLKFKENNVDKFEIDNRAITLELYEYVDSGLSQYGYFKLKEDELTEITALSKEKFFEKKYGVCTVDFKEGSQHVKLLKLDSYQKDLLDKCYLPPSSSPLKSNSNTMSNKTKLIQNDRSLFVYEYVDKNVRIEINQGDLLEQQVDIIVNAANTELNFGGGVAGAIYQRCGRVIEDECKIYLRKRGRAMNVCEVMHTKAYGLNKTCTHVIHACGPRWSDYNSNAKTRCFEDLKNTFFNILIYTENMLPKARSISIPLISSGIFGVPRKVCCEALFSALDEYMTESMDEKRSLKLIKLTNIDKETFTDLLDFFKVNLNVKIDNHKTQSFEEEEKLNRSILMQKEKEDGKKICSKCKTLVKSSKNIECGCEYCVDCIVLLEQEHDNICQSVSCIKNQ